MRFQEILDKHADSVMRFQDGADLEDLPSEFFEDLCEYYMSTGEMPYGTAKARTGDPYQWITEKLCEVLKC